MQRHKDAEIISLCVFAFLYHYNIMPSNLVSNTI
jgi:hypothetical protein